MAAFCDTHAQEQGINREFGAVASYQLPVVSEQTLFEQWANADP